MPGAPTSFLFLVVRLVASCRLVASVVAPSSFLFLLRRQGHRFLVSFPRRSRSLCGVRALSATHGAFAAVLRSGAVVTWGDGSCGGDSSAVKDWKRSGESGDVEGPGEIQVAWWVFSGLTFV